MTKLAWSYDGKKYFNSFHNSVDECLVQARESIVDFKRGLVDTDYGAALDGYLSSNNGDFPTKIYIGKFYKLREGNGYVRDAIKEIAKVDIILRGFQEYELQTGRVVTMKNIDWIKSMDVEQMASAIANIEDGSINYSQGLCDLCESMECTKCLEIWLESEVQNER